MILELYCCSSTIICFITHQSDDVMLNWPFAGDRLLGSCKSHLQLNSQQMVVELKKKINNSFR